jgi:hypothetical protein
MKRLTLSAMRKMAMRTMLHANTAVAVAVIALAIWKF